VIIARPLSHWRVGVAVPRMTDRVNGSDDGRSGYNTCGPTPPPAVIDQYFVKRAPVLDATINYRAMHMHKRGLCCHAVSVCPYVCPSGTFVDHVKTNKDIFEIFSPSGSDTILVFLFQRRCWYSNGNQPNGGVECKGGMIKWRLFHKSRCILETVIVRWAHAARQFVSIEFSVHPYNI